jgi:PAS domain S-box-containing protein
MPAKRKPSGKEQELQRKVEELEKRLAEAHKLQQCREDQQSGCQAGEGLRQSEARLAAALQIAELGVWEYDPVAAATRFDQQCREMLGILEDRPLSNEEVLALIHPDDRPRARRQLVAPLDPQGKSLYETEFRTLRPDGTVRWITIRGKATVSDKGSADCGYSGTAMDITRWRQARDLADSREFWGRESMNALSDEGELGTLDLAELIDIHALQKLMDDFFAVAHIPMSILDVEGRVLVGVGWQEICTRFHRVQPDTLRHCLESDTQLSAGLGPGEYRLYKCKNNLWDMATPIIVSGQHVGNIFTGQFFFDDETIDRELFRAQARKYGFDDADYLAALDRVPRLSRETVRRGMEFFVKLADMLSRLGHSNVRLARLLAERDRLTDSLHQSEQRLRIASEAAQLGVFEWDVSADRAYWGNDRIYEIFGQAREQGPLSRAAFYADVLDPQDRPDFDRALTEGLQSEQRFQVVCRIRRRSDREQRWLEISGRFDRPADGSAPRLVGVVADITEGKRAEEALRESEMRFRAMFEGHGAAMLLIEPNTGEIIDGNSAAAGFYGYSREQLRSMRIDQINQLPPQQVAAERRKAVDLVKDQFIFFHRLADGQVRCVEVYSSPVTIQGKPILFSIIHDITARRRIEEALRESEEKFRSAFANAAIGFAMTTPDGRFVDANPAYCFITGYDIEELRTMGFPRLIHPEDYAANMRLIEQMLAGRIADFVVENRYFRKDGGAVWVRKSVSLVCNAEGAPQWFIALVENITARKYAEEELRQSREDLDRAQEVAQIGSWRLDVRRNVLTWSDENHRIFGVPKGTPMTYQTFLGIVHPDDRQYVDTQWQAGLRGAPYDIEHRIVVNGQVKWVREKAYLEFDSEGKLLGGFGISQDITDRKAAEKELRQATGELERSNEELQQFVYAASHDLREPLRTISGFLKLLIDRYEPQLDNKARQYITHAVEGATRMSQFIQDLLEYSRLDRTGAALEPTEAGRALTEALANLGSLIQEAGASVIYEELPAVIGDPTQLLQLFQNLIGNAVKFRSPARTCRIHVGVQKRSGRWEFSVRDNGIGIDPGQYERIFVIFQRLHTRDEYPGTGVGLAICKRIVERHGGRIWVESEPDMGSTFYFTLPEVPCQLL